MVACGTRASHRLCALHCRLEDQRELLAPAVAHWRQVQEMEQEVTCTKLQLLVDQQEHGSLQLRAQQQQVHQQHHSVNEGRFRSFTWLTAPP